MTAIILGKPRRQRRLKGNPLDSKQYEGDM